MNRKSTETIGRGNGRPAQDEASDVPQSLAELLPPLPLPAWMTPMQAILGRLDVEETTGNCWLS